MSKTHKITQLKKQNAKLKRDLELASGDRPQIIKDIPIVKPKQDYTDDELKQIASKFYDYLHR